MKNQHAFLTMIATSLLLFASSCSDMPRGEEGEGELAVSGDFVISSGQGEVKISNEDDNENLVITINPSLPSDWYIIFSPPMMKNDGRNELLLRPHEEVTVMIQAGDSCVFQDNNLNWKDGDAAYTEPVFNRRCVSFNNEEKKRCGEVRIYSTSGGGCAFLNVWK
jgi:hypothetical protein